MQIFFFQIHDLNYSAFGLPKCKSLFRKQKLNHTYVRFKCFIKNHISNTWILNVMFGKVASLFSQPP